MPNRPTRRITFGTHCVILFGRIVNLVAVHPLKTCRGNSPYFRSAKANMTIRIFLIDEHRLTREILARCLASMPGLNVVGSTCDGEDGIREIADLSPDVVLIETKMKRADRVDICRRALAAEGQTTVAVLTSYLDPDERRMAYQAGVDGYLLKDVGTSNLANWIKSAVQQDSEDAESNDS
jgi:DNA-binding NarL/FixJ family response regulator